MHTSVQTCLYMYMAASMPMLAHMSAYVHAHIRTHAFAHVCTHISGDIFPHRCPHKCLCTCLHACLHARVVLLMKAGIEELGVQGSMGDVEQEVVEEVREQQQAEALCHGDTCMRIDRGSGRVHRHARV